MTDLMQRSRAIIEQAVADYKPYATVLMFSGSKDSMLAFQVMRALGQPITHILHGNTRTGIVETTEFVRQFAGTQDCAYIEADAGDRYRDYVLRKGFFGVGRDAHHYAYHVVKRRPIASAISREIRQRKRNRSVLLVNGARASESLNRSKRLLPTREDEGNVWVNVCHDWDKESRDQFLVECGARCNPVAQRLCRSGECMCGTMQGHEARTEAASAYPDWGRWLRDLEREVYAAGHNWGWGEVMPKPLVETGQRSLFDEFEPMCVSCTREVTNADT